jgi:hypothetical protein
MIIDQKTAEANLKKHARQSTKPWEIMIRERTKLRYREYFVIASNGVTQVFLHACRVPRIFSFAHVEGELRAVLAVFNWLRHMASHSKSRVTISRSTFSVVMGEEACPPKLKAMRSRLLRNFAEIPNVALKVADALPAAPAQERRVAA